jgi:hypothetical protein
MRNRKPVRIRRRTVLVSVGLAATLALGYLAFFEMIPVNRSPISITDPDEPGIPPDFNAVSLTGREDHDTYVVTLAVLGTVQTTGPIHVGILVQELRSPPGGTFVYDLKYALGGEMNYGTPTTRFGNSLTFRFPLRTLGAQTYVVGLDAVLFGPNSDDYVVETPRENLAIARLLVLPIGADALGIAATLTAVMTLVLLIRPFAQPRFRALR